MPESHSAVERRKFRGTLLYWLLIFFCIPAAAYLDTLLLKHGRRHENLFGFVFNFFVVYMFLAYGSLKLTYFVARQRFGEVEISEQKARNEKIRKQLEPRKAEFQRANYGNRRFACLLLVLGLLFVLIGGALGLGFFNKPQLGVWLGFFLGLALAGFISTKLTKRKFDHKPIINIPDRTKSIFNVVGLSLYWEFFLLWIIIAVPRKIHRIFTHHFDLWQLNMAIELGLLLPLILIICTQAYLKNKSAILIRIPLIVLVLMPIVTNIVYEVGMYIAAH